MESPLGAQPPTSSNLSRHAPQEQKRTRSRREESVQQPNGDHQQNGDEWVEPPLRAPVPSFQDYPGLSRQGVLETMMPLGTRPTTRVQAKAKGDPLRRIVQARNLGAGLIPADEGSATPEPPPTSETSRIGTLRVDRTSRRESPSTDLNADSDAVSSPSRQSTRNVKEANTKGSTSKSQAATPSPIKDTSHETPSARYPGSFVHAPVPAGSPFFTAAAMANKNGKPEVQLPLAFLYSAIEQDPELESLLQSATRESVEDKHSQVSRKIKQVKRMYRNQNNAPRSRTSSTAARLRGASMANNTRANNTRHSLSPAVATETTGPASRQPSSRPVRTTNSSNLSLAHNNNKPAQNIKSLKIRLNNPSKPSPSNNISTSRTVSPLKNSFEPSPTTIQSLSRRSSSSSLSSVDSELANQASPNMPKRKRQNQQRDGQVTDPEPEPEPELDFPSEKRARTAAIDSLARSRDLLTEAQRNRLIQGLVQAPEPMESSVRDEPLPTSETTARGRQAVSRMNVGRVARTPSVTRRRDQSSSMDQEPAGVVSRKRPATPTALGRPRKKPRTKISPIKQAKRPANMNTLSGSGAVGNNEDLSESSENHDTCSACGNPGYLVVCDGCDRAWHFDCLQPPVSEKDLVGGKWFCTSCTAEKNDKYQERDTFMGLQKSAEWLAPRAFELPIGVRTHFKNVKTGSDGEYEVAPDVRPEFPVGNRSVSQVHEARYRSLKDSKGNFILCHFCGQSCEGNRDIVQCDYCPLYWHMDCLTPPRASVPHRIHNHNIPDNKRIAWKCPAHASAELNSLHVREPKHTSVLNTSLARGVPNNGLIEVESDSDDREFLEEEAANGVRYKMPREGIKLDFIHKVKMNRLQEEEAARQRAIKADEERRLTILQQQESAAKLHLDNERLLFEALTSRRVRERIAAFDLARFSLANPALRLADDEVANLIAEMESQAPDVLVAEADAAEEAAGGDEGLTARKRAVLERMQEQIAALLATGSSRS